ncbi:MAG: zinc ribbon domain-containing protein [Solobacterium sp.]|nr:zinc ribbon domain-containing protein [Solobacterium sp.]
MKYCPNCGTQLDDSAAFCHNCGTRLTAPSAVSNRSANYINEDLADKAAQAAAIITEADRMCAPALQLFQEAEKVSRRGNGMFKLQSKVAKVYIVFGTVVVVILLIGTVMSGFNVNALTTAAMAIFELFMIIVVGRMIIKKRHDKSTNRADQTHQQAQQILFQAQQLLAENDEVVSVIPEDYRYPLAADYIARSLRNGSSHSMKEAVLNCDNYLHQLQMEQYQKEQIANQELIMMQLRFKAPDIYNNLY